MKKTIFTLLLLSGIIVTFVTSCKKEDDDNNNQEFVADDNTFANYTTWTFVKQEQGASPSLADAHQGNNADAVRRIYVNNNADRGSNSEFPNGTIFLKETKDAGGNVIEFTAMAKRGGSFNSANKDWEWFMLNPADGKIMDRGANLMGGMCGGCHSAKASADYVFSK